MPEHDVIVVGSGATGGWAAKELCERGMDVLLLEAGRSLDPATDFPPYPATRLVRRLSYALGRQPVQARCPALNAGTRPFFVDDRKNPYTYPKDKPFLWFRGRQVGGRLHTWARMAPRMSDYEMQPSLRDRPGTDWPLTYHDLEPYYDHVETFLGLLGEPAGLEHVPDGRYSDPKPLTPTEQQLAERLRDVAPGIGPGRVIRHNPGRIPTTIQAAQATGRLTLTSNAPVARLLIDDDTGRARGVEYVDGDTGRRVEASARAVMLCASTIESVRLLLNSAHPKHPDGVGNSSGLLGTHIGDHLIVPLRGTLPPDAAAPGFEPRDPYDFDTTGLYIPRRIDDAPEDWFGGAYGIQASLGRGCPLWGMLAFGTTRSQPSNRVTIDDRRTDAWGIPVPRITCAQSPDDVAKAQGMRRRLLDLAERGGLHVAMPNESRSLKGFVYSLLKSKLFAPSGAGWPGVSIHETGGARMGTDPSNSIVDGRNRCWDAPNVFVTDGACLGAPGYQNHTLTLMALTVRACGVVAEELGDAG